MTTLLSLCVTLGLILLMFNHTTADIVFDVKPRSRGVLLGQDVTLDCAASETSNLPLLYQWEFNGSPSALPLLPNNSLYIARIESHQFGEYRCLVHVNGQPEVVTTTPPATIVKAYLDEFFINPLPQTLNPGNMTIFGCVTGWSAPPPTVYWQRDGRNFTRGQVDSGTFGEVGDGGAARISSRLAFIASVNLQGLYHCVAVNPLTQDLIYSDTANLTINVVPEAPTIVTTPPPVLVGAAALPLTLDCGVTGQPYPDISWYREGSYLANSPRVSTIRNGSLYFTSLQEDDQGTYFCEAQNAVGQTRSYDINITVAFLDIPFELDPSDVAVLAGQEVTLHCLPPRSVPSASTIWYKDTLPFTERQGEFEARSLDTGSLYFRKVKLEDAGQYFCVAINDYAVPRTRTSKKATIHIEASPIILEPPVPIRVIRGHLLTLKCRAEGRPAPVIKWKKDEEDITDGGRFTLRDSGMELLVRDVIKDDQGSYTCSASNSHGLVSSAPVLAFIIVPPEIVKPPVDAVVRENTDVLIPCMVYGDPRPTVTWYKNGEPLSSTGDITIDRSGVNIKSISGEDEGTYHCKASNEGGSQEAEGLLRIEVAPELISFPEDKTLVEGQPLLLYCDGDAFPDPNFYWTFNGSRVLPEDISISDDGRRLEVVRLLRNHTGTYTCVAENDAGEDTRTSNVMVQVPPTILTIIGELYLEQGGDLSLLCDVDAVPRASIDWSVGGKTILPTLDGRVSFPHYNSLLVRFVKRENSGVYKCTAQNEAGHTERIVQVAVRATPFPPKIVSVRPVSMTSVNVTWQPADQDPILDLPVDTWILQYKPSWSAVYVIYKDDVAASLMSYEVDGLEAYTEYVFRVAAQNSVGTGRYSESHSTRTLETAPSAPRNLQMVSHNASYIELRWEIPAQPNGEIRTYQIYYRLQHTNMEYEVETVPSEDRTLLYYTLDSLQPYTTYSVKVRGATIEGGLNLWGEFSNVLSITTSSIPPSEAPRDVKVRVTSSRSINVSWLPVPQTSHHGSLHGYVIQYQRHDTPTQRYTNVTTYPTVTSHDVTSLLPWRQYDVRVRGTNIKGYGVPSRVVTVRTTPEIPTGSPADVKVTALSSSAISVSWKPVPVEERNCAISGYVVEYRSIGDRGTDTLSLDVGDPNLTQINITGLWAYTQYEVQMHAFTTQVINGFGPNSHPVRLRTAEAVPGPVVNLTINVTLTSAYVTWAPPERPNGVIRNYYVIYSILDPRPAVNQKGSRLRRAVGQLVANNTWEVVTNQTAVLLTDLTADSSYGFHVVAETAAGRADIPQLPMATVAVPQLPSVSTTTTTTTPLPTTSPSTTMAVVTRATGLVMTSPSSTPGEEEVDYLPIIIGVSVGVGVVLLALLIALIGFCCYRRSKKKGSYYDQNGGISEQPGYASHISVTNNTQQPSKKPSNGTVSTSTSNGTALTTMNGQSSTVPTTSTVSPTRTTSTAIQSSISLREAMPGYSTASHTSRPRSDYATNSSQMVGRSIPLDPLHDLSYTSMDDLRHATYPQLHLQGAHYMPQFPGMENPAYEGNDSQDVSSVFSPNTDSTFLRNSVIYKSQQDLYAQMESNKWRKNRMKSQTAAAIAAQRNATSSVFLDTDNLINNDSVVVYDERTAL